MNDVLPNGNLRIPSDASKSAQGPLFPEVDALLSLFKDSCRELVDLQQQVHLLTVGGDLEQVIFCLFSEPFFFVTFDWRLMEDSTISKRRFRSKTLSTAKHLLRLVIKLILFFTFESFHRMFPKMIIEKEWMIFNATIMRIKLLWSSFICIYPCSARIWL